MPATWYAYGTDILIETISKKGENGLRADVVVTCSEEDAGRGRYLRHPRIVVEVRSPSNSGKEWDAKLLEYWNTSSIEKLVIIETDERGAESYCVIEKTSIANPRGQLSHWQVATPQ